MDVPLRLSVCAIPKIPLIEIGDNLASILIAAIDNAELAVKDRDVLVIAQKVVSKAEGRYVDLVAVTPSKDALDLAQKTQKDPRLVEVILSQSRRVVRFAPNTLIVEHKLGYIVANAGVDRSNVLSENGSERVLLLPEQPDRSAERLRAEFVRYFKANIAVIINDSFGRPWRKGTAGTALGAAGVASLRDLRGLPDLYGRKLEVSETALADELAAAASLLMGQADEGLPAVIVSGLGDLGPDIPASALIRPAAEDLFR